MKIYKYNVYSSKVKIRIRQWRDETVKARSWARLSSANVTSLFLPPLFPLSCSVPLNSAPWTGAYSTFHEFCSRGTRWNTVWYCSFLQACVYFYNTIQWIIILAHNWQCRHEKWKFWEILSVYFFLPLFTILFVEYLVSILLDNSEWFYVKSHLILSCVKD